MPIRFRCAYCNQFMAIARRKSGTVVRCPTCAGQVVVPSTDAPAEAPPTMPQPQPAQAPPGPFDRSDFDAMLGQTGPAAGGYGYAPAPAPGGYAPAGVDVEPVLMDAGGVPAYGPAPGGLVLTPGKTTLLVIIVLVLLGLSFVAGLLIGRS